MDKTELVVDMDINEEFKEMFEGMWPKALQKLKDQFVKNNFLD